MSAHANICWALLSTSDLRRRNVTSASFREGIESIANVAELAVMALVEVSEHADAEIQRRIWEAEHAATSSWSADR